MPDDHFPSRGEPQPGFSFPGAGSRHRRDRALNAAARAVAFLADAQDERGRWADFHTYAGESDEWVSGYVGWVLAGRADVTSRGLAERAWMTLRERNRRAGGWGYGRRTPGDADSTAWVLALALRLGRREDIRTSAGLAALRRHVRPSGGVATYRSAPAIRRCVGAGPEQSFSAWCSAQPCVTAAAAALPSMPDRPRLLDYLRDAQGDDGLWDAYWWLDREYPTALALTALAIDPSPADQVRIARAWSGLRARLRDVIGGNGAAAGRGSVFAVACALWGLAAGGRVGCDDALARTTVSWLVRQQCHDGGWPGCAVLRVPPPDCLRPDQYAIWGKSGGIGSAVTDQRGLYTTATVLEALRRAMFLLEHRSDAEHES